VKRSRSGTLEPAAERRVVVCELRDIACQDTREEQMIRREPDRLLPWAVAAGAAAGAGAAAYAITRMLRSRRAAQAVGVLARLEDAVVEALRRDATTGACAIDVAALGPGIIELSGVVPTQEVGQRAARLLHALTGVRTVVNRLEVGSLEDRLADNRQRRAEGEPALRDRQWYGVRVGTGRRRQSPDTDPDRPDDTVERKTRDLEVSRADVTDASTTEPGQSVDNPPR
jgi:hypothetical protein